MQLTEPRDIRCPNKIKKYFFGLIETRDYHDLEIIKIDKWGNPTWQKYEITAKCKDCGARLRRVGINETELAEAGLLEEVV